MIPPEAMAIFQSAAQELAASGLLQKATNVGGKAIDFELKDAAGLPVSSAALRDKGPLVVAFYRGKW